MPTIEEIRAEIKEAHKNGVSYRKLGKIFNVTAPTIQRIERGERIGGKTIKALNLDPSQKLQSIRERRETLNKIAQYWKYKHWYDYEKQTLKDFEENFDPETKEWADKYTECAICHLPIQEHQNGSKMNHEYKEMKS